MAKKSKPLNVRPLYDRILLEQEDAEERTSGGIYLPDSAQEKPMQGKVVGVGIGTLLPSGRLVEPNVKVGDRVLFGKYAGSEIKIDGQAFTIVREGDLLGILDGS